MIISQIGESKERHGKNIDYQRKSHS